jgi:hypothetical protein
MIKLNFMFGREVMNFFIRDREIFYTDRLNTKPLRCIPKDEQFIKKIRESRNRYSPKLIEMFTLSEKSQQEYNNCSNDEQLTEQIIKDCLKKGLVLLKQETVENGLV